MICDNLRACVEGQLTGKSITKCSNNNRGRCVESSDRRSRVKCEERKKKYQLENTMHNHVVSYKMDDGIIVLDKSVPAGTCKCDYMFLADGAERNVILIELKGVDVAHSLVQIQGTLRLFKNFFQSFSHVYGRVVVASSTPDLRANPNYVNLVKMIRTSFGGNIKISKIQFTETDVDLGKES